MDLFKLVGTIAINGADQAKKDLDDVSSKAKQTGDDFDDAASSGEGKLAGAFSKIGSGAVALGKTVVKGMAVAGAGVSALVTSAVNSYADYEQLVGGVETLFGDSAKKVMRYADEAYQTAGMSANNYMETVTSFSASLLQSLDGDTAAAADKANQAIVDMSDNANKMGSSMESIQNAYQGFAKQNYTMLDNLKLGYGGTKEEMARLLADAQAISGIEYDISSYADVVDAIHVIQTEMGITGTTAKEASTTISGSISTMKASWENMMTAMADGGFDMEPYINGFVASVSTVMDNILPRIEDGLGGVVFLIQELAPKIIAVIPGLVSTLLPAIIDAATGIINALVSAFPSIVTALVGILPSLINGIQEIFNALIQALPQIMQALVAALPTLIPMLVDALVSMIVMLCTMLPQIIQPIIDNLPMIIVTIVDALISNLPALIKGCIALIAGLVAAYPQIISGLWEAIKSSFSLLLSYLGEWLSPIWNGIVQWLSDLWNSITQWFSNVITSVSQWFSDIWEGVKTICSAFVEWIDTNITQPILNFFQSLWDGIKAIWDGICNAIDIAIRLIASIIDAAFQIITLPFRFIWENCKEYVFAAWEWIKNAVSTSINAVKSAITKTMNAIKTFFKAVWDGIKSVFTTVWNAIVNFLTPIINRIKSIIETAFNRIKSVATTVFNAVKNVVTTVWNAIKNTVTSVVNAIKTTVTNVFNAIKSKVTSIFNAVKSTVASIWNGIKNAITTAINTAKNTVTNVFNSIKEKISNVVNGIKTTVTNVFNKVKDAMEKPIQKAKDTIKGIVDTIKGFFSGMNISFPKIKLPHFSIKPSGWKIGDLLKGSIPSLGIEWYAKAMRNPMIMNQPTVFGYDASTGRLQGGGEAGSEVVSGTNTLMNMISSAVAGQNTEFVAVLYKILEAILAMDENMGGNMREALAGTSFEINRREFARLVKAVN